VVADSILAPAVVELRVIPNGVDLGLFHPGDREADRMRLGLKPGGNVLVFAAQGVRSNEFKDYETFVRALELLGTLSDEPITAVALGAAASSTKTLGSVLLKDIPSVPLGEVGSWLRAADIYVHPARAETFPLTVLEALACGIPVIASAVGGIPEQLRDQTGVLVQPGDARALCDAIALLLQDAGRRVEMGRSAAADAAQRFGADRQAAAYLEWFSELTNDRGTFSR
jgi:glycosyltransferase involved in cell wall biosynthesis